MEIVSEAIPENLRPALKELYDEFSFSGQKDAGTDIKVIKGFQLSPGFTTEAIEYAYDNFEFKDTDVILASFPKTGTNWTLDILRRLLNEDEKDYKLNMALPLALWLLEGGSAKKFPVMSKLPLKRRMFITHLNAELINLERLKKTKAKVVYVLRNPKDQIVSWYHFCQKIPHLAIHPLNYMINNGFSTFFDYALQGKIPICTRDGEGYPHHIISWYKHRDDKTVRFLYYEDLKENFVKELKSLADFLDVDLTDERAEDIEKKCSMEFMKANVDKQHTAVREFQIANLRKGGKGDWKETLTVAQSERMDEKFAEVLAGTDISFKYT